MEKFMILLTPKDDKELVMMLEANCADLEAAQAQATAYLVMAGPNFKSPLAWRQAANRIINNFNL